MIEALKASTYNGTVTLTDIYGREHIATTWQNGVASKSTVQDSGSFTQVVTEDSESASYSNRSHGLQIQADGQLIGGFTEDVWSSSTGGADYHHIVNRGYPGDVEVPAPYLLPQDPPPPGTEPPPPDDAFRFIDPYFALGVTFHRDLGTEKIGSVSYVLNGTEGLEQHSKLFRGDANGPYVPDGVSGQNASLALTSDNGQMLLTYRSAGDDSTVLHTKVWQLGSGTVVDLGERVKANAINNQAWVVGTKAGWVEDDYETGEGHFVGNEGPVPSPTDPFAPYGRGELGFLWKPSGGVQTFHDLLPAAYRPTLRSCVPYAIANPDANGVTRILFTASTLDLESPSTWIDDTFCLEIPPTGEPSVEAVSPARASFESINSSATSAVSIGQAAPLPETPGAAFNVAFLPVKDKIHLGYDPPMRGDGILSETDTLDEIEFPVWRTSLGRKGNTSLNQHIQVLFSTDDVATKFKLVVKEGGDQFTIEPTQFTSALTPLTIRANPIHANRTDAVDAVVEIHPKNAVVGANTSPAATLKIVIFPERTVDVGVWYVSDPNSPSSQLPVEWAIPSPSQIEAKLNEVYAQCCVKFKVRQSVAEGAAFHKKKVRFDFDPKDGNLESIAATNSELRAILNPDTTTSDPYPAKLDIIIMKDLRTNGPGVPLGPVGGFAPGPVGRTGGNGKVLIFADNLKPTQDGFQERFFNTCTHEAGHELRLATRGFQLDMSRIPFSLKYSTVWKMGKTQYHDIGYFPSRPWRYIQFGAGFQNDSPKLLQGLMWPQTAEPNVSEWRWLRWEDWKEANERADDYHAP